MSLDPLKILDRPKLRNSRLVLGFSGWMDGGEVSTGTIYTLARRLHATRLAELDAEPFCILNFPGPMEVSALFRPHARIDDGLITAYVSPANVFFASEQHQLILFMGREPNFHWQQFADNIFRLADAFDVRSLYFIGSVSGLVPHTREPRLLATVSDPVLRESLRQSGLRFSNYEGPASIVTYLTVQARLRGLDMISLVAEIPAYVQGRNPICIEWATRRLAAMLNVPLRMDDLRLQADGFERKLNEVVQTRQDLLKLVGKLEQDYDNEVFDTQMGDLKDWLEQQGIRLD